MNFTNALQVAQARSALVGPLALLFCVGCSSSAPRGVIAPERGDPRTTIDLFMTAVNGEDLEVMSQLWGTKDGPVADGMDPIVAERRLRLMQIYLEHESYEVLLAEGEFLSRNASTTRFRIRLTRNNCQPVIPFTLVQARDGWLIENIDLAQAGNPRRGCPPRPELLQ